MGYLTSHDRNVFNQSASDSLAEAGPAILRQHPAALGGGPGSGGGGGSAVAVARAFGVAPDAASRAQAGGAPEKIGREGVYQQNQNSTFGEEQLRKAFKVAHPLA